VDPADRWAALAPLGWDAGRQAELEDLAPQAEPARVVRVDRGGGLALAADGVRAIAGVGLACGDWVALDGGRAALVLRRRTQIRRRAAGRPDAAQVIAANVDVVLIVQGLDRPLRIGRLTRGLALARDAGARPVVTLTKADLGPAPAVEAEVAALGADVLRVSASSGEGIDAVAALARPSRTVVMIGESGAGKSTLANALLGEEALATGDVRAGDGKGRHTTTARHLVVLPGGGALIDTPGIRELGLWADAGGGVATAFADVEELAPRCRFGDCRHDSEPGCAVRAAVERGELAGERLDDYLGLMREVAALERRADERARRAHGRAGARMVREVKRMKGRYRGGG
jgi:ribosome small subunit-dependent GTPase A